MSLRFVARSLFLATTTLALATAGAGCTDQPDDPTAAVAATDIVVVDQVAEAHGVRLSLEAPITEASLDGLAPTIVAEGPDPVTDALTRRELSARATIEDDGFTLVLTIDEALSPESAYTAVLVGGDDAAGPVELARFDAPTRSLRAAGFNVKKTIPADGQGLFDNALAARVDRKATLVRIHFEKGSVDCADLEARGAGALRVYSGTQMGWKHDMYDSNAADADSDGDPQYRGHIDGCSATKVDFRMPGPLHGGTEYRIRVRAKSTDGVTMPTFVGKFRTANPMLDVQVNKVHHDMSSNCDSAPFSGVKDRCDVYLGVSAVWSDTAAETRKLTSNVPASGDWGNWGASDHKYPDHSMVLNQPLQDDVALVFSAFDHDNGDRAKNTLAVTATVVGLVGTGVSIGAPPIGALIVAAGAVIGTISAVMTGNSDDYLGASMVGLQENNAWHTVPKTYDPSDPDAQYGRKVTLYNKHGWIILRYTVTQSPQAWSPPVVLI